VGCVYTEGVQEHFGRVDGETRRSPQVGAGRAEVDVDIFTERLQPGDALLLCSDGLWEMVRDPQLTNILTEVDDLNETVNLLIQRANENGGEDNISAVLVRGVAG
jgi:protein phosphatase